MPESNPKPSPKLLRKPGGWTRLGVKALGLIVPSLLLLLWHQAVLRSWVAEQLLPPPTLVAASFVDLVRTGELQSHIWITMVRIAWSLFLGGSLGLIIGFALGLSRTLKAFVAPTFDAVAQLPVIGWIPLLIIFLGIGEALKIAAVTIAVVIPFAVHTSRGMAQIPLRLIEVARVYRFTRVQSFFRVILPSALPSLFSGLRQGVMQAWLSLVFVELLASSEGLGYLMVWGRQLLQMDLVVVGIIVIGLIGLIFETLLKLLEKRLLSWQRAWI